MLWDFTKTKTSFIVMVTLRQSVWSVKTYLDINCMLRN